MIVPGPSCVKNKFTLNCKVTWIHLQDQLCSHATSYRILSQTSLLVASNHKTTL